MKSLPCLHKAAGPPAASSRILKEEKREMGNEARSPEQPATRRGARCRYRSSPSPSTTSTSAHFQRAAGGGDRRHRGSAGFNGTGSTRDGERVPKPLSPNRPRGREGPKGPPV